MLTGATGPMPPGANVADAIATGVSQTDLEMLAGRRTSARHAPGRARSSGNMPLFDCNKRVIETGFSTVELRTRDSSPKAAERIGADPELTTGPTIQGDSLSPNAPSPNPLLSDTKAAVEFLKERAAVHALWHPQLSFKPIDPVSGEEGDGFETCSFQREATTGEPNWDEVRRWIDLRRGRGNIYWTVNAAAPINKKPAKVDIRAVVSLHADLDPDEGEDQDAAERRLIAKLENYRHTASIILKSGGGAWGIYDLAEPMPIDGDRDKIKEAEAYNIVLAHELGADDCQNIDRIARLPGTVNIPTMNKRAKGRRSKLATVHSRTPVRHPIDSFAKATNAGSGTTSAGQSEIKIDWSKVRRPGWLKSEADLPADVSPKLRAIISHTGTLPDLNDDLLARRLLTKPYGSWSDVTYAIAAASL